MSAEITPCRAGCLNACVYAMRHAAAVVIFERRLHRPFRDGVETASSFEYRHWRFTGWQVKAWESRACLELLVVMIVASRTVQSRGLRCHKCQSAAVAL